MSEMLQYYFKEVGKTKLLTREEEIELSKRVEQGDARARDRMIRANLRLAISIAKKYQNKGCSLEDLIQESSVGLMKAVERFDWRKGFKFSTYACWWIKQSVRRHIASHSSSMKLPTYAKNMLWKAKQVSIEYEDEFGVKPTKSEVADILGVSVSTIDSIFACSGPTESLEGNLRYRSAETSRTLAEVLVDDRGQSVDDQLDNVTLVDSIKKALNNLTDREQKIVRMRFGIYDENESSDQYSMTEEEVNKIKKKSARRK